MTRALRHARLNLLSGVTTGRVAGDPARNDFYLRDAIEAGRVPGPRILPSGQWVSTTTGGTIRSRRVDGPRSLWWAESGTMDSRIADLFDEAEPMLLTAYAGLIQRKTPFLAQRNRVSSGRENASFASESWNRPGKAAEWKSKLTAKDP